MRVLGIDPGLTRCGVGVVDGSVGRPLTMVDVGVVRTSSTLPIAERLVTIEKGLDAWIEEHRPDAVAVERVFARSDSSTIMGTAQASGIALVVAARRGLPIAMHTPSEVKAAVSGNGRADKAQDAHDHAGGQRRGRADAERGEGAGRAHQLEADAADLEDGAGEGDGGDLAADEGDHRVLTG